MKRFDLFLTSIGDDGAIYLSTRLKNIQELRLYKSGITQTGMKEMAVEIRQLDEPVRFVSVFTVLCFIKRYRIVQL